MWYIHWLLSDLPVLVLALSSLAECIAACCWAGGQYTLLLGADTHLPPSQSPRSSITSRPSANNKVYYAILSTDFGFISVSVWTEKAVVGLVPVFFSLQQPQPWKYWPGAKFLTIEKSRFGKFSSSFRRWMWQLELERGFQPANSSIPIPIQTEAELLLLHCTVSSNPALTSSKNSISNLGSNRPNS